MVTNVYRSANISLSLNTISEFPFVVFAGDELSVDANECDKFSLS